MTALVLLAFITFFAPTTAHAQPGLQLRGGWPHVATKSGELRVAYLGGSITAAADGWRSHTTAALRERFATVTEFAAGMPGTGSNLGVCRLEHDVLRHRPDLLFVEFAVNDANAPADRIERTMEGIVRQTRRANPATDIIFVYTVSTPGLPDLQAGKFPSAAVAMEKVAAHYGLPSLHFGVEVARRIAAGELVFKADAADPKAFSLDGVHPTSAGHRVYFAALERALPALLGAPKAAPHALPPPLHPDNWENATLLTLDEVTRHGDWAIVPPDDPNLRGATKHLLPPVWRAAKPGATIEFEFTGTILGLVGIAAPDSGTFRVTVDDQPPVTATFFDSFASPTFCRVRDWFYPARLAPGPHRVRVELLGDAPDKAAIKAAASKPLEPASAYADNRLTLAGVVFVAPNP